jgi:hypothetical protein
MVWVRARSRPPEGDQELCAQGDDDRLAHPLAKAPDPFVEPG